MKTYSTSIFCLIYFFLIVTGMQILKSQDQITMQNKESKFSGSESKIENIVLKSDSVFIGQIKQIGQPLAKSPGQSSYHGVQVQVLQVLKGASLSQIEVSLFVKHGKIEEATPKLESPYIFFVKNENNWNIVLKLLPATDDNVTKVKALIAAAAK